jgi:hypothetical protein
MKKFIVPVLSICFFISCSTDEATDNKPFQEIRLKSLTTPGNTNNTVDYIGALNAQILGDYCANYVNPTNLASVVGNVENLALNDPDFVSITGNYTGLDVSDAQWALDNVSAPTNIIDATLMGLHAKNTLSNFITMLDGFENKEYRIVYASIVAFEADVNSDALLSQSDKQIILATTSTARYCIAYNGPKKRTWTETKAGIIASVNSNAALAVTTSVTANIMAQ